MTDLLIYTIAVYGLAWAVTKSNLTGEWRHRVDQWCAVDTRGSWFVSHLLDCIACTGTWVGLAVAALLPLTSLDLVQTWADVPLLAAWSTGACWLIGRATGDAD